MSLHMIEDDLTDFISFKYDLLLSKLNHWMNNFWKVLDKVLIEIAEVNEELHLSEIIVTNVSELIRTSQQSSRDLI